MEVSPSIAGLDLIVTVFVTVSDMRVLGSESKVDRRCRRTEPCSRSCSSAVISLSYFSSRSSSGHLGSQLFEPVEHHVDLRGDGARIGAQDQKPLAVR